MLAIFVRHNLTGYPWTETTIYTELNGKTYKYGNKLLFGTINSNLLLISLNNPEDLKHLIFFENDSVIIQELVHNHAYVISGSSLHKVNIPDMTRDWTFGSDDGYTLERSQEYKNMVYVSANDGSLYALNSHSGKIVWKINSQLPTKISNVLVNGKIFYAPDFYIKNNYLYLEDRAGSLSKIDARNGKKIWKTDVGDNLVNNILYYGNKILITTKTGHLIAINSQNGKAVWNTNDGSEITCFRENAFGLFSGQFVTITNNGKIIKHDAGSGKILWESESFGLGIICPPEKIDSGVFAVTSGSVISINMHNGKTIWKHDGFGNMLNSPLVYHGMFRNGYILSDLNGVVWKLNNRGDYIWRYNTFFPIISPITSIGNKIIVSNSNGVLYKLNKISGRPTSFNISALKFKTSIDSKMIGGNQVFEITLHSNSKFGNPFSEGNFSGVFVSQSNKIYYVNGFYYDNNEWKIRFNPPVKGVWKYNLIWQDHGVTYTDSGKFESSTDTTQSFLKVNKSNSQRLTLDGKTIFNGVGIQDTVIDNNLSGTPLDDFAAGVDKSYTATSSSGSVSYFRSDSPVTFNKYLDLYGKEAGFNLYRVTLGNASAPLYKNIGSPNIYLIDDSKFVDEMVTTLKERNIHIWFTIFNNEIPVYGDGLPVTETLSYRQKARYSAYIKYIIARYGAYVDIWELTNEEDNLPPSTKEYLLSVIKDTDFENRLLTVNPEEPQNPLVDLISVHWYQWEKISDSDVNVINQLKKFINYNKPVIFSEQGNATENWDPTSPIRMRIRLWTAFFNQGTIIFWNASEAKLIPQKPPLYANIYLGVEERLYISVLQKLTSGITLLSEPISFDLSKYGIRGYGLTSQDGFLAYYVHYSDWLQSTKFTQVINLPKPGVLKWYDVATGALLEKTECPTTTCEVISPSFTTDIMFKLVSE